jgi:hypothetical protein
MTLGDHWAPLHSALRPITTAPQLGEKSTCLRATHLPGRLLPFLSNVVDVFPHRAIGGFKSGKVVEQQCIALGNFESLALAAQNYLI